MRLQSQTGFCMVLCLSMARIFYESEQDKDAILGKSPNVSICGSRNEISRVRRYKHTLVKQRETKSNWGLLYPSLLLPNPPKGPGTLVTRPLHSRDTSGLFFPTWRILYSHIRGDVLSYLPLDSGQWL